jgi:hypothetical protein
MPARPRRPHRRRLVLVPAVIAVWLALIGTAPASAAIGYSRDLYFAGSWEHQVDNRTCVAASTAMMMNLLERQDLNLPQLTILRYAQVRDALNDAVQRGSDPLGWSRAASHFSRYTSRPTTYRWEAYPNKTAALKRAATQIAATGKPVGLVIQHGKHAVVMTGVRAGTNPASGKDFSLVSIAVSDPLGYAHRWYTASSYALNTYLELDATTQYDAAWYGKYVIVVPQS